MFETHFSNGEFDETTTAIGNNGVVVIPDIYLTTGKMVYAFIYLHTESDDGETVYRINIPVKKRGKPIDQEATPQEQSTITQAIAELNNAINVSNSNAEYAEGYMNQAHGYSTDAYGYSNTASEQAILAGRSAETAEQMKNDAIGAATRASASATRAEDNAVIAVNSANAAAQSAEDAESFAESAVASATDAAASAQSAHASAQSIQSMTVEATTLTPGSPATAEWSDGTLSLGIPKGDKGLKGDPGDPGFSPTATVSKSGNATTLTVTDKTGTTTATILDGSKGDPGDPGTSPTASVSKSGAKSTITITDEEGTTTAEVLDGAKGDPGVSPTIAVSDIPGGHRVTITDADHPGGISFDVMDGGTGNGISSAVLNQDYTLTLNFTDGTSYTTSSIRGEKGEKGDTGEVASLNSIAPDYSQSSTYAVGDYCIYNDLLYVCLTTISTAEAWTASHWMQVNVTSVLSDLNGALTGIEGLIPYVIGKNKYNPTDCHPENGKLYRSAGGTVTASGNYAITGKIPVEAETTYIFTTTPFADVYSNVTYYKGSDGNTFISRENSKGAPFTTPAECTFIGINLFGRTHTEADYIEAIAVARLEIGTVASAYEAYEKKRMLSPDNIVNGGALSDATAVQSQINLYDKRLAIDGSYFNTSGGGSILQNTKYAFTGKIPVEPNRQYNISRDPDSPLTFGGAVYCFADDGSYMGAAPLSNYVYSHLYSFTTPANCHTIAVNMPRSTDHTTQEFNDTIDTIMMCIGTQRPLEYSAYEEKAVVLADGLSDAYTANRDCFVGKKWLATGTSVTWYDGKLYQNGVETGKICRGYIGNVARRKKLSVINDGINGATLGNVNSNSLINRYTSLNWSGVDIATLEFGINDFGNAVAIGTAEDAAGTDTFAACLKTVIEYALAQNPKLCLVICTEPDVRGATANSGGHYLYEYTDVTIAIAKQYRLPVCDWFYHSGINALTKGNSSLDYLTADGTHPNNDGHMRMGAMLNQLFDTLIC